jgi:hypothetical protein
VSGGSAVARSGESCRGSVTSTWATLDSAATRLSTLDGGSCSIQTAISVTAGWKAQHDGQPTADLSSTVLPQP